MTLYIPKIKHKFSIITIVYSAFVLLTMAYIISGCATNLTVQSRGESYLRRGDYDSAISEFKRLLEKNPEDPVALYSIGRAYYGQGSYDEAITYLKAARQADPTNADIYLYLGMSYEQKGEYQQALREYDNCAELHPSKLVLKKIDRRRSFLNLETAKTSARKALQQEEILASNIAQIPDNTVAVTDFTNVGQIKELDPLEKGLAGMLITDLSQAHSITVVERMRIQELFKEMKLEGVDPSTAARPGMLLGASKIVTGSFMSLEGREINMVSSLTMTKTKVSRPSKSVSGTLGELFDLEKELAFGILDDMGVVLTEEEREAIKKTPTKSVEAFMAYSRGLGYMDAGMYKEAAQEYEKALSIDPDFEAPRLELQETRNLMTETRSLTSMENLRQQVALEEQQISRLSDADINATRGLMSTPEAGTSTPRGGGSGGVVPTVRTVEIEVIFP